MHKPGKPVIFLDFDNTLTDGDMLDALIEEFSPDDRWRVWEAEWVAGRLSARDCLQRQIENLRVSREALLDRAASVRVDPCFARILRWARPRQVEVIIVSDSFVPIIVHVLRHNAIEGVPVIANQLEFSGDRLRPSFPYHDPASPRSASAKGRHLAARRDRTVVFAGDGRSDLDAALEADVVFAKDALADALRERAVAFHPFVTLEPLLAFLETMDA